MPRFKIVTLTTAYLAGVGAGGPIAGGMARLSSPSTALALAAGAVASSAVCGRAADRAHRRAATCSA